MPVMESFSLDFKLSNLGTVVVCLYSSSSYSSSFGDKVDYFVKYYSCNPGYRVKNGDSSLFVLIPFLSHH